ncbi:EAL domain-containing protein [Cellulosilyticum sp. I15G10I2]|uniref:EAL domain-containing protein n=1 Tax=Cellulosilyticum sp. I15G10I2 TaxID=1892843 RepID=UPI00085BF57C|nr:EAL domain-containing protein [Cellulosilyticum sp. I15G10I2]
MAMWKKDILKVLLDDTEKQEVKTKFNQLKENVIYGQQLCHIGSWTHDLQKDEIFFTDEVYDIMGCTPQDFDGKLESFYLYIQGDDLQRVKQAAEGALTGKEYDIEYRIVTPGGIEKYVHEKTKVLCDEQNTPIKMIGIIQDITKQKLIENELKTFGDNLNQAQKVAGVGSWKYDVIEDQIYWSEELYRIYNIQPLAFKKDYDSILKLIHPKDQVKVENAVKDCLNGKSYEIEYRIPQSDGPEKIVISRGEPLFGEGDQVISIVGTLQDITEKKQLEEKLEKSYKSLARAQHLAQMGSWEMDVVRGKIYWSDETYHIYGITPGQFDGTFEGALNFIHPDDRGMIQSNLEESLKNPSQEYFSSMAFRIIKPDGDVRNLHNLIEAIRDTDGRLIYVYGTVQDITEKINMEKKMVHIATHDELTNLPNRSYFKKHIQYLCEDAKKNFYTFVIMMLDIDGFKYINDAVGYQLADKLIVQITERLKAFLGEQAFIARYSGDQFAVIVSNLESIAAYENVAKNIIQLFSHSFEIDTYELNVTMSVGISTYIYDEQDTDSLIKYANIALLRAKEQGKNRYTFYSHDMDIQNYKDFTLRNDLCKAIQKNQLRVYYQPQVNLQTSEITSAEALIRWEHPTWGIVSSDEFIAIAEEAGFIVDIGKWILREVCRTYKSWISGGFPAIKIAINYSSVQFYEKDFVEHIKVIIDEFKLDPSFIIVEILENVLNSNFEQVIHNIKKLQALGIQVALDDFGTGFASLEYLNRFKVDILKIDRIFTKDIPLNETTTIIVKSMINLAKELKIKLVAEGIETWEQLDYLRKLNCYLGQGYLFSKPISQNDFEMLLAVKKCGPTSDRNRRGLSHEERRKFFRIQFTELLQSDMTILEIQGKKTRVGNTKVLVKNIGPGGLCFISNIRFPVKRDMVLQFTTQLLGKEIKLYGCPVWANEVNGNLYEYGLEFIFDEKERTILTRILNQLQIIR